MKRSLLYIVVVLPLFFGCEKILMEPVENTPHANFEALWESYNLHYAGFEFKNINWDSVHTVYANLINNSLTNDELFELLSQMLSNLKDEHVWLIANNKYYSYNNPNTYIYYYNYSIIASYLTGVSRQSMFTYGKLEDNIGYIHISTFSKDQTGYDFIDNILEELSNFKGIVIDVRNNEGGSDLNAKLIASRFYDIKRAYSYIKMRNGPKHSDFTENIYNFAEPTNNARPDIPVVLLTDRSVGSAGEDFTLMMRVLPSVTVIGDYTRGNPGGSPRLRELQNGWLYYTPTCLQYTMENEVFINTGIAPEIFVTGVEPGNDLMIEKAINLISNPE